MKRKKKNKRPDFRELHDLIQKRLRLIYPESTLKFMKELNQFVARKIMFGHATLDHEKMKDALAETTIEELQQIFTIHKKEGSPVFLGDAEHWELEGNEED